MKWGMKCLCSLLALSLVFAPADVVRAETITTDQALKISTATKRQTILTFLSRADVASQLRSLGVERKSAEDRVALMSDDEIDALNGKLGSLLAGGQYGGGGGGSGGGAILLIVLIVLFFIWWFHEKKAG
jgi:hypothetical protein